MRVFQDKGARPGRRGAVVAVTSVYKVQLRTARIAQLLTGYKPGAAVALRLDLAAALDDPNTAPALFSFRAKPGARSRGARELRQIVAEIARDCRRDKAWP